MRHLTIVLALLPLTAIAAPVQAQTEMVTVSPEQPTVPMPRLVLYSSVLRVSVMLLAFFQMFTPYLRLLFIRQFSIQTFLQV